MCLGEMKRRILETAGFEDVAMTGIGVGDVTGGLGHFALLALVSER